MTELASTASPIFACVAGLIGACLGFAILLRQPGDWHIRVRSRQFMGALCLLGMGAFLAVAGQLTLVSQFTDSTLRAEATARFQGIMQEPFDVLTVQVWGPDPFRDQPESTTFRLQIVTTAGTKIICTVPRARMMPANTAPDHDDYRLLWQAIMKGVQSEGGKALASRFLTMNDWRRVARIEAEVLVSDTEPVAMPERLIIPRTAADSLYLFWGGHATEQPQRQGNEWVMAYRDDSTMGERIADWPAALAAPAASLASAAPVCFAAALLLLLLATDLLWFGLDPSKPRLSLCQRAWAMSVPAQTPQEQVAPRFWSVWTVILLAGVAAAWALIYIVIPFSSQDFPLNDDWAYGYSAFVFARGGKIVYPGQGSMPQLGQWLWAWPFVHLFGESHASLRLSTVVLSLVGVAAFFDLLRQADLSPRRAAFVAACLAMNPFYSLLTGTFLTDVPTLALSLLTLALYWRAFRSENLGMLMAAMAASVFAGITRQNTIAASVAAGLLLLRYARLRVNPIWLAGVILPALATIATHFWFIARPDAVRLAYQAPTIRHFLVVAFSTVSYVGLAAIPLLILEPLDLSWRRFGTFVAILLGIGVAYWFSRTEFSYGNRFPYLENLLSPLGSIVDSGGAPLELGDRPVLMPNRTRAVLTLLGFLAGALLLLRVGMRLRASAWAGPLLLFSVVHLCLLQLVAVYDRYLVVAVPGILYFATQAGPRPRLHWLPGLGAFAVLALVSISLTHDWLAWNAARWALGRRALERGVAYEDLEGGLEWDCWTVLVFGPDSQLRHDGTNSPGAPSVNSAATTQVAGLQLIGGGGMPHPCRYGLSFSELPNTRSLDREEFRLWLIPGRHQFYFLEAEEPAIVTEAP